MTESRDPTLVLPAPPVVTVPVQGGGLFPVRRIYCIGRNYAAHAREMGHDPDKEPPFFFLKPADAVLTGDADLPYPPGTADLHPEVELAVALGRGGRDIAEDTALEHVWGYGVALDMTRRDLQGQAKALGRPWEVGKAFDHSAPIGLLVPATTFGHPQAAAIRLTVNGVVRQEGDVNQMIWTVPEMIALLSRLFTLAPGDLILTGTPAGVGPVVRGDALVSTVAGLPPLHTRIV